MSFKEKLKPKKFNVILLITGFVLAEIILNSMMVCADACPDNFYFELGIIIPSAITGIIFYVIGSFLEKIFYRIIKALGE